ncbi:MAG: site-specific integrase [Planctomycetes bacterium]|nr:site-specific integrase [Planctomycetota bacterium]
MSVRSTTFKGRPYWLVDVCRDGKRRRRHLDRKTHRKRDALAVERQMIAALDEPQEGELSRNHDTIDQNTQTVTADEIPIAKVESPAQRVPESKRREPPTFASFAREYLDVQDKSRSNYQNKERDLRLHLVPFFGEIPIDEITRRHIDRFKAHMRKPRGERASSRRSKHRKEKALTGRRKGGPMSPKTINNTLGTLRTMLRMAADYGLIDRVPRIQFEKVEKNDPQFLEFEESTRVIEATSPEWRTLVHFAVATGLRRGELMEVRWGDLQLNRAPAQVRVRRGVRRRPNGSWESKATKSERPRSVPLDEELAAMLRAQQDGARHTDLVFPGADGGYLSVDQLYREVVAAAQRADVDKHVHPHMLRHTFASQSTMTGVPTQVVQRWMGHASYSTTERYAHLAPDFGEELIEEVARRRREGARKSRPTKRSTDGLPRPTTP